MESSGDIKAFVYPIFIANLAKNNRSGQGNRGTIPKIAFQPGFFFGVISMRPSVTTN